MQGPRILTLALLLLAGPVVARQRGLAQQDGKDGTKDCGNGNCEHVSHGKALSLAKSVIRLIAMPDRISASAAKMFQLNCSPSTRAPANTA